LQLTFLILIIDKIKNSKYLHAPPGDRPRTTVWKALFYLKNSYQSSLSPIRVTAGSTALNSIPVCRESGFTHFISMYCD